MWTSMKPTVSQLEPVAPECLKLIPLYWIYCLASVQAHLTNAMILTATYIGWCCMHGAVDTAQDLILRCLSKHDKQLSLLNMVISKVSTLVNGEEPVRAIFQWIRLAVCTIYLLWAVYKGWQIHSILGNKCQRLRQMTPLRSPTDRDDHGARLMVLDEASPVLDGLRPTPEDIFAKMQRPRRDSSEDAEEFSIWAKP